MKPYPLAPDAPAEAAGEWLAERHYYTLGGNYDESIFVWFAGKPCNTCQKATMPRYWQPCLTCYADPPAEYARDVLYWFIRNGGATHPRHERMAQEFGVLSHMGLSLKRRILRLFSGAGEDEKCRACNGRVGITYGSWRDPICESCHGSGVIPGGGVRIKQTDGMFKTWEITPEQLLPPEREALSALPAALARV